VRDPELVREAERVAADLERAWYQWRELHGPAGEPVPTVSSYVGYSLDEPWGEPRVVIGLAAADAEWLITLLDRHECPARAASARAERGSLTDPSRCEAEPGAVAAGGLPPAVPPQGSPPAAERAGPAGAADAAGAVSGPAGPADAAGAVSGPAGPADAAGAGDGLGGAAGEAAAEPPSAGPQAAPRGAVATDPEAEGEAAPAGEAAPGGRAAPGSLALAASAARMEAEARIRAALRGRSRNGSRRPECASGAFYPRARALPPGAGPQGGARQGDEPVLRDGPAERGRETREPAREDDWPGWKEMTGLADADPEVTQTWLGPELAPGPVSEGRADLGSASHSRRGRISRGYPISRLSRAKRTGAVPGT